MFLLPSAGGFSSKVGLYEDGRSASACRLGTGRRGQVPEGKICNHEGGAAGIVAAHLLQDSHEVTIFEKENYLGGHTHTVSLPDGPDGGTPVDTGFIVFNEATYPLFIKFLEELEVPSREAQMSFGFH